MSSFSGKDAKDNANDTDAKIDKDDDDDDDDADADDDVKSGTAGSNALRNRL